VWWNTLYCTLLTPCYPPGPTYDNVQWQQNIFLMLVPFMILGLYWAFGAFDSKDEE